MKITTENWENWAVEGDVYSLERPQNSAVMDYFNLNSAELELLEYNIEYSLNPVLLSEYLNEDLPGEVSDINKRALIADIVHLSRLFFDLSESKCIKVSLEPVSNDMCRIFHVDNIKQRMICTYKGQGTEWLTESNLNRTGLGGGDNKKIVKDFDLVRRAEAFEVLLLKGKKAESSIGGAVHRSPEIHSSAQTRVLLKIDECC